MIKNRLAKLAKTLGDITRNCKTCYGSPFAVIRVINEIDPNGPGFRDTGEHFLMQPLDRVGDDLCCVACGRPAVRLLVKSRAEDERAPTERRISL